MMSWLRVRALLLKNYYLTIGNVDRIAEIIYWPFIGLLLWGFTTVYLKLETGSGILVGFFLGAVVLSTVLSRAELDISTYILEDFYSRNIYNLFVSPLTTLEMFLSSILFGLFKALMAFGVLVVAAYFLYSYNVLSIGAVALPLLAANLWIFGSAMGILVSGVIYRYGAQFEFIAWATAFGLTPVSAVFYPLKTLENFPGLYQFASILPSTHAFEGMRTAITTATIPWTQIGLSFLLNVAFILLAYFAFHAFIESSRKSGFLATQA